MENRNKIRLGRPCLRRRVRHKVVAEYFKPQGIPVRELEIIELTLEEVEALRLKNIKNLNQEECASRMKTSQSTFQRILSSAYRKLSLAVVEAKAIKIENSKTRNT